MYEDGSPGEIFFKASKEGTTISGLLDSWAIAVSLALQHGTPIETLIRLYKGTYFEPNGLVANKEIKICSSIADYVARHLEYLFIVKKDNDTVVKTIGDSGLFCPDCNKELIYQAGCLNCPDKACGWTRCG